VHPAAISASVGDPYRNEMLMAFNDHEVRMSVMTGSFGWHHHPDSDEVFMVLEGELVIEFVHGEVVLGPGEMLTVEKGVVHRTRCGGARSVNLTFERRGAATVFVEA
jgi:mannose-6-phosphate isomerase-like protein (cupin superfamily)